jgi:hypothetical protein
MALEEITTEIDVQKPAKTKDKPKPKKPLASMKKRDESVAPYPFKNKGELDKYRKNMESIVKPGYGEMGFKERSIMEEPKPKKPKVGMMKKLGEAAGKVIDKLDDKSIKETMLKQTAPMEKLISMPIMEEKMADNMKKDLPEEKALIRKAHDYYGRMKEAAPFESVMGSKETPMDEKKSKLESLKKSATKKD